jgi:hypothetical protein
VHHPTCHRCERILLAPDARTRDDQGWCWCASCFTRSFWDAYGEVAKFSGSASVQDISNADLREELAVALYYVMRRYRQH